MVSAAYRAHENHANEIVSMHRDFIQSIANSTGKTPAQIEQAVLYAALEAQSPPLSVSVVVHHFFQCLGELERGVCPSGVVEAQETGEEAQADV